MKSYFKLYNTIIFIVLLAMFYLVQRGIDDFVLWLNLGIFYYYFLRTLLSKPLVITTGIRTVFKLELLFLLFYYLLFYLPYQTYLLGMNDLFHNDWIANTYTQYTSVSIVLSSIGLVMFMRGYERKIEGRKRAEVVWSKKHYFRLFSIILVAYGITFAVFMATSWAVLIATYTPNTGDNTMDGISFLVSLFASILFGYNVFLFKLYKKITFQMWIGLALSSLWCLLLLVIGDRNTFFLVAIPLVGGVFTYLRNIGLVKLSFLVLGALIIYQVIEKTRSSGQRGFDAVVDAIENIATGKQQVNSSLDKSSFSITNVTSRASFFCVEKYGYFDGKFKFISFIGIIPYTRILFVSDNDPTPTSSRVLTREMLGPNAIWGVGTNVVSDIYMDFGLLGVIVLMYYLGASAKYIQSNARMNPGSIKWCCVYLMSLGLFAEIPRYSLGFPVRNIIWALFIFWAYEKYRVKKTKSKIKKQLDFVP